MAVQVVAVIEIIVAVVKAAKEIEEKNAFSRWQGDVSGKLDQILANTQQIIQDLRQMRLDFRADLENSFRSEYIKRLQAEMLNLSATLSSLSDNERPSKELRLRLTQCVVQLRSLVYSSYTYGTAVWPLALAAASVVPTTMRIAGMATQEIAFTLKQLREFLISPLLDATREGSLASALLVAQSAESKSYARLRSRLGPVTLGVGDANVDYFFDPAGIPPGSLNTQQDVEQYKTTIVGDAEDSATVISASPIDVVTIAAGVKGMTILPLYLLNIQPPSDESGVVAYSRGSANVLRDDLVKAAQDNVAERVAETERIAELKRLIELAQTLLVDA